MEKRKHGGLFCLNGKLEHSPRCQLSAVSMGKQTAINIVYCTDNSAAHAISLHWFPCLILQYFETLCHLSSAKERNPTYCHPLKRNHSALSKVKYSFYALSDSKTHIQPTWKSKLGSIFRICIHALSVFLYRIFENSLVLAPEGAAFPNRWYESVHLR